MTGGSENSLPPACCKSPVILEKYFQIPIFKAAHHIIHYFSSPILHVRTITPVPSDAAVLPRHISEIENEDGVSERRVPPVLLSEYRTWRPPGDTSQECKYSRRRNCSREKIFPGSGSEGGSATALSSKLLLRYWGSLPK